MRGGKCLVNPPSVFHGIPKSCFKQEVSKPRTTKVTSSEQRQKKEQGIKEKKDKINNFENFVKCIAKHVDKKLKITRHGKELTMYMTDTLGKTVIKFLHFREVNSPFVFLQLVSAETNGFDVPKGILDLQQNNLLHKWSQIKYIMSVIDQHDPSNQDNQKAAMDELNEMED